jgi:hypothetical protein
MKIDFVDRVLESVGEATTSGNRVLERPPSTSCDATAEQCRCKVGGAGKKKWPGARM